MYVFSKPISHLLGPKTCTPVLWADLMEMGWLWDVLHRLHSCFKDMHNQREQKLKNSKKKSERLVCKNISF